MTGKKVSVIVAGSWGTALATVLAENNHRVVIWTRDEAQAAEINNEHKNSKYINDVRLSEHIAATTSIKEAVHEAEAIIVAAPSSAMRHIAAMIRPHLAEHAVIIHATKGFEPSTLKRMSTVIKEEIPQYDARQVVVLSGPSHAEEVVERRPTTVVVAAEDLAAAELAQDLFINHYFRVYTNPDVIGVEVSGALKNIIAIGAGMSDGLGFGDNAKAALLTRGLAEISRLGVAMGANPLTFAGLAGFGDLIVTCTSKHSRNWRAGYMIAKNQLTVDEVLAQMGMVVEGIKTTEAAYALSVQYNIPMPITEQLHSVLFADKVPSEAVNDLMGRVKTQEMEEVPLHMLANKTQ